LQSSFSVTSFAAMASIFAKRCFQASGSMVPRAASRMTTQPLGSFGSRLGSRFLSVQVGDAVPSVSLDHGFPPVKVPLQDYCKHKKIVLVGLPGAFTPT